MPSNRVLTALGLTALLVGPLSAGTPVEVVWTGEVEFNGINSGPLSNVDSGDSAVIRFVVDSSAFVDSTTFPTRGYDIGAADFSLTFPGGTVGLQDPIPANDDALFVIRNNDPAVDGFFLGSGVNGFPNGVPLALNGNFGKFRINASVTYGNDPLPSLDVLDAQGDYDFTGLTVFGFSIIDGPFDAMGMIFESLSIHALNAWTDEGCALAGVSGSPSLEGSGDLSAGSSNSVDLTNAAPNATAGLFLGFGSIPLPFKGGTLKPNPFVTPVFVSTSPAGAIPLSFVMPAGIPAGGEIWVQWAIVDAAAIYGVSLSNAVLGITP